MTQNEFVLIYVAVPLVVSLGWLIYRTRVFLRNAILYALAVGALLAVVRAGDLVWGAWSSVSVWRYSPPGAPICVDAGVPSVGQSCWM